MSTVQTSGGTPSPSGGGPGRGGLRGFLRRLGTIQLVALLIGVIVLVGGAAILLSRSGSDNSAKPPHQSTGADDNIPDTTTTPLARLDTEAAVRNNWPMIANDEFTGDSLNPTLWNAYDGPSTNQTGTFDPANITVGDGELQIHGRDESSAGLSWHKGQQYGRWEVRARSTAGNGFSPVLLLWPDKEDWPQGGEVDFMEMPDGARNQNHVTVHYGEDNSQVSNTVTGDFTQWHTYAVEWTPDHVAGFVDGQEVFRTTDPSTIPPRKMHLAIQQDPGPMDDWIPARDSSTPDDVALDIDWVRIYSL